MRKIWMASLCLAIGALALTIAAAEPNDGRVRLIIKATDPDGGKLVFLWKQIEGPAVRIADPCAGKQEAEAGKVKWVSDTYFIPTEPGVYKFEVAVKNEGGEEAKKVFEFQVLPATPPPVAVAGKDKTVTAGQIAVINGIDSHTAPGLNIVEWEWRVIEAPDKFKISPKKLKERQFDFETKEPGRYLFELRVFDGKHWSEPSRAIVTVKPRSAPIELDQPLANEKNVFELPPTPDIVAPRGPRTATPVVVSGKTIKLGETIILDGSASQVDDKLKADFYWEQQIKGNEPLLKTLAADRSKPFIKNRLDVLNYPVWTCAPTQPGEYTFALRIEAADIDGKGASIKVESNPVIYKVISPINPPVARIFAERVEVEVGDYVKLDGSTSRTDGGGQITDYIWGPAPGKRYPRTWAGVAGPKVQFQAEEEGEYVVTLIVVSDSQMRSEPNQIVITAHAANKPPTVELSATYQTTVGARLAIEPTIHDPENDPVETRWSCLEPASIKIPEELAKNKTLVFAPQETGVYIFRITVTDAKGRNVTAQTQVGVKPASAMKAPTAVIDGPKAVKVGAKVKISGARSASFPTGKPLVYAWAQEVIEDGPKIAAPPPKSTAKVWEFVPTEPGRYIVSLTVSDGALKSEPERFEFNAAHDNAPPVAQIAALPNNKIQVGAQVLLDGSASEDPNGDPLIYKWRKFGGNAEVEIVGADQDKCAITAASPGSIQIELVVNDGKIDSAPARKDLLAVMRETIKPIAQITGAEAAKIGDFVELSGAQSVGEAPIAYIWSQSPEGAGPSIGLRGNDLRQRELRFKVEKPGSYILRLEIVDCDGCKSDPVTHKIEVKGINRPPIAAAMVITENPIIVGKEIKLSARKSLDPEGAPLTYKWKQISGELMPLPEESMDIINLAPQAPGEYVFEVVVNDGENDSLPAKVAFIAQPANQPPVAVIAPVTPCEAGGKIMLDGTGSHDPEGAKLEYRWSKVSGPDVSFGWHGASKSKVEVALKEGEYVFELKVFDGKEWSEPQRAAVKTRPQNAPPIAAISNALPIRVEENMETTLDASASTDPDNGPQALTFIWRALDRIELRANGPLARFTPKKAGILTFQLKVSDGKATSEPLLVKVEVLKAGALPVAIAKAIPNPICVAQKGVKNDPNILELNAGDSRPGAAAKNAPLTYAWSQVSGEDLKLRSADLTKRRIGLRIFIPGTYRFQLVVSDGQNTSQPCFIDVKVLNLGTQ